jgi:hypothetical protein
MYNKVPSVSATGGLSTKKFNPFRRWNIDDPYDAAIMPNRATAAAGRFYRSGKREGCPDTPESSIVLLTRQ